MPYDLILFGRGNYNLLQRRVHNLRENQLRVLFVSFHGHLISHDDNLGINPKSNSIIRYTLGFFYCLKVLLKYNYKSIDFHGVSSYGLLSFLTPKNKTLLTIYGPDIYSHLDKSWLLKCIVKQAIKRSCCLICSTSTIRTHLDKLVGSAGYRLEVVPFGINLNGIDDTIKEYKIISLFNKYNLPQNKIIYLHNRRFMSFWNVELIAKSFVESQLKNSILVFVFPKCNNSEFDLLKSTRELYGASNGVYYIGELEYHEYISILSTSNFLISCGKNDLLANSLIEAMYCRAIPMINRQAAYSEFISESDAVWIDGSLDEERFNLLDAFERSSKISNSKIASITSNNYQKTIEEFDISRSSKKIIKIVNHI